MDDIYRDKIASEFYDCIKNTIVRIKGRPGKAESAHNPFQERLFPPEAIFWARFERSFSTSFGQRVIEIISKYVALATGAEDAETQRKIHYKLSQDELLAVSDHNRALRTKGGARPSWKTDLAKIQAAGGVRNVDINANFDLWFRRDGKDHYFSIKTVKPNIDQTAVAKEDMLKVLTAHKDANAYFGLYYNPFGEQRSLYRHNPPFTIFDMHNDPCVLIGKDYWDTVGKDGSYEEVLDIADSVKERALKLIDDYGTESLI